MNERIMENPYEPPKVVSDPRGETPGDYWVEGKLLACRTGAILPSRCVKTNKPLNEDARVTKTYSWCSPWVYLSLLINILVLIILYFCLRKRCKLVYCCTKKWKRISSLLNVIAIFMVIFAIFIVGAGAAMTMDGPPKNEVGGVILVSGFLLLILGLLINFLWVGNLRVKRHRDGVFYFKGCSPEFLRQIEVPIASPPHYP